jgi:hypothetical protein
MAYFEQTRVANIEGTAINPAEQQPLYTDGPGYNVPAAAVRTATGSVDGQITLLRRIVKLLESTAATDPQQRQRITIDAGTLPAVTTVTTVTTVTNIAALNGWNQQMFSDPARTAYNTGIRQQLTFS